jgi:glucose/mannose-6-phosphate isomerase
MSEFDPSGIGKIIGRFPGMFTEEFEVSVATLPAAKTIILSGMGGSALAGELYRDAAGPSLPFQLYINRGYALPSWADQSNPVIVASYSGDTEETISVFKEAREKGLLTVAMSAGGALKVLAEEAGVPWVELPGGMQPRFAVVYMFRALHKLLPGPNFDLEGIGERLLALKQEWEATKEPAQLAKALQAGTPALFIDQAWQGVGKNWQANFAENAKLSLTLGIYSEFNHNEIQSWRAGEPTRSGVFVQTELDNRAVRRREEFCRDRWKEIYGEAGGYSHIGRDRAVITWSLAYLGLVISYRLAELRGVDPGDISAVMELKEFLKA